MRKKSPNENWKVSIFFTVDAIAKTDSQTNESVRGKNEPTRHDPDEKIIPDELDFLTFGSSSDVVK